MNEFFKRIVDLMDFYKIKNDNDFALNHLGYNSSEKINRLKKIGNKPSSDIITDILKKFPAVNSTWLLTGEGLLVPSLKTVHLLPGLRLFSRLPVYGFWWPAVMGNYFAIQNCFCQQLPL